MRNFMSEYQNYTAWDINELAIEENKFEFTNNCKAILEKYLGVINRIPFVNHLGRCGLFTWVVLIAFALMFRRKEFAGMILCVPLFCGNFDMYSIASEWTATIYVVCYGNDMGAFGSAI